MATADFRTDDERLPPEGTERRKSWWTGCLIGCLATAVVLLLVGVLAAVFIARNWRDWASSGVALGIKQGIDDSDLPAEEKQQIKVEIDRGVTAYREGRLSDEQAAGLVQQFFDSPLMTLLVASATEKKYLDNSGLSEEERAEARDTLRRFLRGSIDQEISQSSRDAALAHVAQKQSDGNWMFRDKVSDDELRAFLADAKKAADEANVPEQPLEVDPSDEVKRILDSALTPPEAAAAPDSDLRTN